MIDFILGATGPSGSGEEKTADHDTKDEASGHTARDLDQTTLSESPPQTVSPPLSPSSANQVIKMNGLEARTLHLIRLCVGEDVEIVCQDSSLPGLPDFSIPKLRAAIFADGVFWHPGRGQRMRRVAIKFLARDETQKAEFWMNKAETNTRRDKEVNKLLREMGWKVIRLKEERLNGHDPLGYVSKSIGMALFQAVSARHPSGRIKK